MKTIAVKKLGYLLFWLAPFLLTAGLTSGLLSGWGTISLLLIVSGSAIAVLWLIRQNQQNHWWSRRSTQASTNALVATSAVLIILGLVNFLGTRYHLRKDLTETQLFTLAPQSRASVRSLSEPVKVWVFNSPNPQDQDLLENYHEQNRSKFKYEYVDPQAAPGLAQKFHLKDNGEVYLESGNRRQLVQVVSENERLSEAKLTNRLQQITSTSTAKIYVLQGDGEHPISPGKNAISQAIQALGDRNFIISPVNLAEKSVSLSDAAVVVVAGATRSLLESEEKALQDYVNRGGNLLLMIDPNTDPKLDTLLAEWGIKLDNRLAVDIAGNPQFGPAVPIVNEYGKHPITKDFGKDISFYSLARPIQITPVAGVEATPLLFTKPFPDSWAESDLKSEKLQFDEGKDIKGPLTLGVALRRKQPLSTSSSSVLPTPTPTVSPKTGALVKPITPASPTPTPTVSPQTGKLAKPNTPTSPTPTPTASSKTGALVKPITPASPTPTPTVSLKNPVPSTPSAPSTPSTNQTATESRMVVIGNSDFATDGLFEQQLNGDVFLNSVTWLSQQDQQPLSIRPKEANNRRINLTTAQANLLTSLSLIVLPLLGLVAAIVLWWRRR
ncbi:MAG: Gldg family protein [Rhizonema sp. PD37]|nr:Gldg family protein [Rhizonema sp. PD37]